MYTNINLQDINGTYNYIAEYNYNDIEIADSPWTYKCVDDTIILKGKDIFFQKKDNSWEYFDDSDDLSQLHENISTTTINIYFPQYSLETYNKSVYYSLVINTWLYDKEIVLGTFIFNRNDSLALNKVKKIHNEEYYEYVSFKIIDPMSIIYSEDWEYFRNEFINKPFDKTPLLRISLTPVELIDGKYATVTYSNTGYNSIILSDKSNKINFNLSHNINLTGIDEPTFICNLELPKSYNIRKYINEIYHISDFSINYNLVIGNENDLYGVFESGKMTDKYPTRWEFKKSSLIVNGDYIFNNGYGWKEGINVVASINIFNNEDASILYLLSNKIPLTRELFSYFVGSPFELNGNIVNSIKINNVDMNNYNINCVNKIEQNIIQYNGDFRDSKKITYIPSFYSVQEAENIIIHPEVNEIICINLDKYKNKVENFSIKIDNGIFSEIGRVPAGILFKIIGNELNKTQSTEIYYILDQNHELVTCGKYMYKI